MEKCMFCDKEIIPAEIGEEPEGYSCIACESALCKECRQTSLDNDLPRCPSCDRIYLRHWEGIYEE